MRQNRLVIKIRQNRLVFTQSETLVQKTSENNLLIKSHYYNFLQNSVSGRRIDLANISLGQLREKYLDAKLKQERLKSLFPPPIAQYITDKHYIKTKDGFETTEEGIKSFRDFLETNMPTNDPQQAKNSIKEKMSKLGIELNPEQIERIYNYALVKQHKAQLMEVKDEQKSIFSEMGAAVGNLVSWIKDQCPILNLIFGVLGRLASKLSNLLQSKDNTQELNPPPDTRTPLLAHNPKPYSK